MDFAAWQQTPYTAGMFLAAAVTAISAMYVWRRVDAPGASVAALLLLACTLWTLGNALELASETLSNKLFWGKIEYLGIVAVPPAWLAFALHYTDRGSWLTPRLLALLGVVPAITLLLVATNEAHGLLWATIVLDTTGSFPVLRETHGAWFWVHALYSYGLLMVGTFLLAQMFLLSRHLYRWQGIALLFVVLAPWLVNALFLAGINPAPGVDLTPLAFTLSSVALAGGISHLRLGDLLSVSRQAIAEYLDDPVLVLDARDHIVYLNVAAQQSIGRPSSELVGKPMERAFPDWSKLRRESEAPVGAVEELMVGSGDSKRIYDVRVSPQVDWRGRLVSRAIVLRNVAERKRAEEESAERAHLTALVAEVGAALAGPDSLQDILRCCTRAAVKHLGVAFARIWVFNEEQDRLELRASAGMYTHLDGSHARIPLGDLQIGRIAQERRPYLTNEVLGDPLIRDQEWVRREGMVAFAGYPLLLGDRLVGVMAAFSRRPLTDFALEAMASVANGIALGIERLQAMEALQRSVTERKRAADNLLRFKLGIERSTEAVFITDVDGTILYINPAFERTYGFTQEEALGKTPRILKSGRLPQEAYQQLWNDLLAKKPRSGEFINKTKAGQLVQIEGSANPILNDDGEIIGFLAIQRDITERKQLEERLLRAQRLETAGRIAGQVAHDFNNLLTPLAAYPELIKMQLPADHPARRYCDPMLEAVEQMAEINTDMLALGRRGHLDQEPVDLNRLVEQGVAQIMDRPSTLDLHVELAADLLPASGSPAQLLRVITNLVSNAREAMQEVGRLTLKTENVYVDVPFGRYTRVEPGRYIRLSVGDTGCGIPPEIRDRIFDSFFTTKRAGKKPGSGLGLSIVQAIVDDHRGYLDLETEVGKGTTFSAFLPVSRDAIKESTLRGVRGGSEEVLVVDDDARQREAARELLRTVGYRVEVVSSGEEAIEYLKGHPADLLILDMIMPDGMDGVETYRRALGVRPGQRAIIVSGFAESARVQEVQALGAGAFLRKPVTLERLAHAVRAELDRSP